MLKPGTGDLKPGDGRPDFGGKPDLGKPDRGKPGKPDIGGKADLGKPGKPDLGGAKPKNRPGGGNGLDLSDGPKAKDFSKRGQASLGNRGAKDFARPKGGGGGPSIKRGGGGPSFSFVRSYHAHRCGFWRAVDRSSRDHRHRGDGAVRGPPPEAGRASYGPKDSRGLHADSRSVSGHG